MLDYIIWANYNPKQTSPKYILLRNMNNCNLLRHLQRFKHTMRTAQGALIVASILNMILGFSTIWGAYAKYGSYCTCS
jgi:hypothetical protein